MASRRIRLLHFIFTLAACVLVIRAFISPLVSSSEREKRGTEHREIARNPVDRKKDQVSKRSEPPQRFIETTYTAERVSEEYDQEPTPEEWQEFTRILLHAEPSDLIEVVKARFSTQAGTTELAVLVEAFDDPVYDDTRQRIIEVFSCLRSNDFAPIARHLLNDDSRPITDQLVCASALSLVRLGQAEDLQSIYRRINAEGEDPEPEGALYSDADGMMYAISEARSPELEQLLIDAATGKGMATTGRGRYAATAALRYFRTDATIKVLDELSKSETNLQVRKQAERSLNAIQRRN